jgi:type IV secretory pathway VirB10-like protein
LLLVFFAASSCVRRAATVPDETEGAASVKPHVTPRSPKEVAAAKRAEQEEEAKAAAWAAYRAEERRYAEKQKQEQDAQREAKVAEMWRVNPYGACIVEAGDAYQRCTTGPTYPIDNRTGLVFAPFRRDESKCATTFEVSSQVCAARYRRSTAP